MPRVPAGNNSGDIFSVLLSILISSMSDSAIPIIINGLRCAQRTSAHMVHYTEKTIIREDPYLLSRVTAFDKTRQRIYPLWVLISYLRIGFGKAWESEVSQGTLLR